MKLSVIIPAYNALDDLKHCIDSVLKNVNFDFTSVMVINDCSNEETSSYLNYVNEKFSDKIRVINNEENLGFIKTCNKGISEQDADIYVLLNSDTIIPSDFCEKIVSCFQSDKSIGIASPIASFSSRYYILKPVKMSLDEINERLEKVHNTEYPEVPSAEGFCFCITKETVDKIGVLDTVFGKGYHEEIDYCYRAWKNGIKSVLIDDLYVYHKNNVSFGAAKRKEYMEINSKVFNERWQNFYKNWVNEHKHINPIRRIRKEFLGKGPIAFLQCEKATLVKIFGNVVKLRNL